MNTWKKLISPKSTVHTGLAACVLALHYHFNQGSFSRTSNQTLFYRGERNIEKAGKTNLCFFVCVHDLLIGFHLVAVSVTERSKARSANHVTDLEIATGIGAATCPHRLVLPQKAVPVRTHLCSHNWQNRVPSCSICHQCHRSGLSLLAAQFNPDQAAVHRVSHPISHVCQTSLSSLSIVLFCHSICGLDKRSSFSVHSSLWLVLGLKPSTFP